MAEEKTSALSLSCSVSERQLLSFSSIECLSLSLFVTNLAPDSRTCRKRERKNILQGLAAPWLVVSLGCCDKAPRANGLQTTDASFSQFCQLEVRGQGSSLGEFCREPSSGCQAANLSLYPHLEGAQGDPSSPRTPGGHCSHS